MTTQSDAIKATLKGDWEKAIELNLELTKINPKDVESLNRLGFAYGALGKIKEAKKTYKEVLDIDDTNPIALKNLKRLGENISRTNQPSTFLIDNSMFLEEVGKTKVVTLVNTAPPKTLHNLQIGQPVNLVIKRLKIFVLNYEESFLGMLPDNVSRRLIKFIKGGNKYISYVKSIEERNIAVFIKETKRVTKFKNQPSFMTSDVQKQAPLVIKKNKNYDLDLEETEEE